MRNKIILATVLALILGAGFLFHLTLGFVLFMACIAVIAYASSPKPSSTTSSEDKK